MQVNELRAEVVRNGMTMEAVAAAIGMRRSTLWRRFQHPDEFTLAEIIKLKAALRLDGQRILDIFFCA